MEIESSSYYTCGDHSYEVECLEVLPASLSLRESFGHENFGEELSVDHFNSLHPEEQLDFKCNCHGFTFANGKFFITNHYVASILDDEYLEVTDKEKLQEGDFDVIGFWDKEKQEWIHSCKYKYELFIQKEGVRKFSIHRGIDDIANIDEYRHASIRYFQRKERSCPGICVNAIGERRIKTFANNAI